MSDPARYSPLYRRDGIQLPWELVDKNACRRLTLLIGKTAFIALLYYLLVVISMKLHFSTSGLSLIWPSNALLAATLVLSPKRHWWFYLLAIVPAHIAAMSPYNLDLGWLVYQIAFNSALTAIYAAILQRFKPRILYFEALPDVLIFLGVSVAVPVLMNWAAIYPVFKFSPGSSALLAHNSSDGFFAVWTSCWINNSASFIAFVPAILVCATQGSSWFRGFSSRRVAEGALLTVLFILMGTFLAYGRVAANGHMAGADGRRECEGDRCPAARTPGLDHCASAVADPWSRQSRANRVREIPRPTSPGVRGSPNTPTVGTCKVRYP